MQDTDSDSDYPMTLAPSTGDFLCPPNPWSLQNRVITLGNLGENSTCLTILFVSFGQGGGARVKKVTVQSLRYGSRVFSGTCVVPMATLVSVWQVDHALSLAGASRTSPQSCYTLLYFSKSERLVISSEFGNLNDCMRKEEVANPTGLFFPASGSLFAGALEGQRSLWLSSRLLTCCTTESSQICCSLLFTPAENRVTKRTF